ncbi:MAG: hypothetical protein F6K34_01425 [Okeania sp. SIO4D6]|nr:hypothetical protein [Okeania sp. SIO4D6]
MNDIKNINWQEIKHPTGCTNVNEKLNQNIANIDDKIEKLLAEVQELREKRDKVSLYETVYNSADERVINALKILRDTINFVNYTNGQVGQESIAEQYNDTLMAKINNMTLLIGEEPIVDEIPDEWLLNEANEADDDISDISNPNAPTPSEQDAQLVTAVTVESEVIPDKIKGIVPMNKNYQILKEHFGEPNMSDESLKKRLASETTMNKLTEPSIEQLALHTTQLGEDLFDNKYWFKSTITLNEIITQIYGHEEGEITKILKESYGFSNKVSRVLYILAYDEANDVING